MARPCGESSGPRWCSWAIPRTHRSPISALFCVLAVSVLGGGAAIAQDGGNATAIQQYDPGEYQWNGSIAIGKPWRGALIRGVQLPPEGANYFTWDFPLRTTPNRPWRRWAADRTVNTVLTVLAEYRLAHPLASRVGIADLSRPHGGSFGKRFGGLGHASHQNGTDVDVLYPRFDGQERAPSKPSQIDRALAQDLVDRFVAAGAQYAFVGPNTKLTGPPKIVEKLVHHDDHIHIRFFNRGVVAG